MPAQLFLIVPSEAQPDHVQRALLAMLAGSEVAAMLIERGERTPEDYETLVQALIPAAQQAGTAVLIEGEPGLVRRLGADGLHAAGDIEALRAALQELKPDLIVGARATALRDDAMRFGELEVDYLFFGPETANAEMTAQEMAEWWAETMEIPCVLGARGLSAEQLVHTNCEFIAVRDVWDDPDPAEALRVLTSGLERANA
jgi:thiamine-phosphate pyrophosphorylase